MRPESINHIESIEPYLFGGNFGGHQYYFATASASASTALDNLAAVAEVQLRKKKVLGRIKKGTLQLQAIIQPSKKGAT